MFLNYHIANQEIPSEKWDKAYRFGFNGQEKVNEIAGIGNHNTAPDKFQQGEVLIPGMVTGARSVAAPSTKGQ